MRALGPRPLIVVGTRRGESAQRDRAFARAGDNGNLGPVFQKQMEGGLDTNLYLPIAGYSLTDVWDCLSEIPSPESIDIHELADVYQFGGGECPMVRDTNDKPCASARFGCWVCTVVRKDKSAENLVAAGFTELGPYSQFRSWISEIRNDLSLRCDRRRNGQIGPGPFRLKTRKMILAHVRKLEKEIGCTLINEREEQFIRQLWKLDTASNSYREMERFSAAQVG